jgi:UDP-N-acetylmuramate: L-alanyl-gamma-D-glutamyl-meso-diaminopimelate ligase
VAWFDVAQDAQNGWKVGAGETAESFTIRQDNEIVGEVKVLALPGQHNRLNALAALIAARHVGVPLAQGIQALETFGGVKRRLEVRGVVHGVTVIDDFAHHPTAIRVTIEGLRQRVGANRILAVLEPRSNTMKLGTMSAQLAGSLADADQVFCYAHDLGWNVQAALAPLGAKAECFDNIGQMVAAIAAVAQPTDTVLVMSNGGFAGIHEQLLHALQ